MGFLDFNIESTSSSEVNSISCNESIRFISEDALHLLSDAIGDLKKGESIHYDTNCGWTPHEMLLYLLGITGKANVYIATWAIKEYPAQTIVSSIANGLIENLYLRLDYRIKTTCPSAYHLLKNNCTGLVEAYCHAKITVIQNDNWDITIVGSANYSKNPRGEAGVITENKEVAEMRKNFILLNNGLNK